MNSILSKFLSSLAMLFFLMFCEITKSQTRPNIIIFIADDLSANDLACAGNLNVKTPNIDKLATSGIRFTNTFLTTSSCSPSRASIITGRYPHNTGAAELHTDIPDNQIAFPKLLREAGYYTAQAGKWHFGSSASKPAGVFLNAFDRSGGSSNDGGGTGGELQWVNYLKERPKEKPFFFWFAAHDAHRDWDKNPKPITYNPNEIKVPTRLFNGDKTKSDLKEYYEEVSRFDFHIGEVVEELKKEGIFENTMIIVMADNGRPFPGYKTRLYDDGLRTPFVVHWENGINKPGSSSSALISSIDIAPTLLDIAGVKKIETIQGKSFRKLLKQPSNTFRKYVFAEHNWHDFEAYERMIRTEKYLYIENGLPHQNNIGAIDVMGSDAGNELKKAAFNLQTSAVQSSIFKIPQPATELFDNQADPENLTNLSGNIAFSKQEHRMKKTLGKWRKETGDTQPGSLTPDWYSRETYQPLPEKGKRGTMPGSETNASIINKPGPF